MAASKSRQKELVSLVMGSDSDLELMNKCADTLRSLKIPFEMRIISAHREPDVFFEYASGAKDRGIKVIIAAAGMAAHLPGMCAALFPLPVIGIPVSGSPLSGQDALYSILQMPPGVPTATVAINGAVNAALLAARILAVSDKKILGSLEEYSASMRKKVIEKDVLLQASLSETK